MYQVTDNDDVFDNAIYNNKIDESYSWSLEQAVNTSEMVDIEKKYENLRKDEFEFSITNLRKILYEDDEQLFEEIQNEWGKNHFKFFLNWNVV